MEITGSAALMDVKMAIPLGLILNELMTNSFKYAFNESEVGKITIQISEKLNVLKITYSDSGNGFSEEMEKNKDGFGLRMIKILSNQMGAISTINSSTYTFEIEREN